MYMYTARVRRNLEWDITFEQFKSFWKEPCTYCGTEIKTIGLDRVDNNIGYVMSNIVPCCKWCNYMKRTYTVEELISQCKKIVEKLN